MVNGLGFSRSPLGATLSPMDDDIRRDIAFALSKHIRSNRPGDADEARMMAAADVLRHLRLCGWKIEKDARDPGTDQRAP